MPTRKSDDDRLALMQGTLDLLILKTLLLGACHGQGIARIIQRQSEETFLVDHGSLYLALQRLEDKGWISAKWRILVGEQPQGAVLFADAEGPGATGGEDEPVAASGAGHRAHSGSGRSGGLAHMFRRRRRPTDDFGEEVRAHLQLEADDLKAQGLTDSEAHPAARRAFGNVTAAQERFYERRRIQWFDDLRQDVRYGLRGLRQNPAFTLAAVLTLALGMGANTAIFSLIDAALLRSLPVHDPSRLYFLNNAGSREVGGSPPYPCFERFRAQSQSFAGMAAYAIGDHGIRIGGRIEQVDAARVSGDYHAVLGLTPLAGRLFNAQDEKLDPPVAVISYAYWQRRFGGAPDAIGKTFTLDDHTFTIVGITPKNFHGLVPGRDDQVTLPITIAAPAVLGDTGAWWFKTVARLRPGATAEQAQAEINPIFQAFMNESPSVGGNAPRLLQSHGS